VRRQISFGYTEEDLRILLTPMAASGAEPLGSMGTDTPSAVLSQRSRLLYDYFVELFAQVTNPPLDAIREEVVTSMARVMGPEHNLLEPTAASCRQIVLRRPVLDNDELNKIVHINDDREHPGLKTAVLKALYDVERGAEGLADALEDLRQRACDAIAKGAHTHTGHLGPRLRPHQGADPVAVGRLRRASPPGQHQGAHHCGAGRRIG
jgi:glutamate synthase (NADPH/NADH) large chain